MGCFETVAEKKDKKPSKSKFKQQTLPAWRPILTPTNVLPAFFIIGIVFVIVGGVLLHKDSEVMEENFDYTSLEQTEAVNEGELCKNLLESDSNYTDVGSPAHRCVTRKIVNLKGFNGKDTYLYYGLDGFYQNHRRYVDSRSDPQLRSKNKGEATEECDPIEADTNGTKYYAPCGLIANSLFNDTIELWSCGTDDTCKDEDQKKKIDMSGTHISWHSDRNVKFKNPDFEKDVCDAVAFDPLRSLKPPNWPVQACELGREVSDANECPPFAPTEGCVYNPWSTKYKSNGRAYENEDLIVWMRTAALPNFRKLYRRVGNSLEDGPYEFTIGYNFPVAVFKGKKRIILSTTSSIGGKNPFLGIAYIVVGCLSLVAAIVFIIFMALDKKQKVHNPDLTNMKWD